MINKFGDGISWEAHIEEIIQKKNIFHKKAYFL